MEESSGCIVVQDYDGVPHILMVHGAGNWKIKRFGFPKGNIDRGEKLERAAIRETEEETGITPEIIKYLGHVDRHYGKKKRVHAYLAKVKAGHIDDKKRTVGYDKSEVDVSKFYPVDQALEMAYTYQRPLFKKAKIEIEKIYENKT